MRAASWSSPASAGLPVLARGQQIGRFVREPHEGVGVSLDNGSSPLRLPTRSVPGVDDAQSARAQLDVLIRTDW